MPLAPAGADKWMNLVLILLLGNILYIGLVTIAQKKLDQDHLLALPAPTRKRKQMPNF
jgi:hypothetical protein